MQNADLTSTYTNGFDTRGTLKQAEPIRGSARARKGIARGVLAVAIGILLCIMPDAGSSDLRAIKMTPKQYAYYSLNDIKQYKCLAFLYGKESAWNPNARNGSHAGIPQGRSKWLLTATPIQQVEWGLRYIKHRYSTPCNAKDHWLKNNFH
jgi:hypothetical protein